MPDEKLPQRTLKTTFWLACFFLIVFALRGQYTIVSGLAVGAAIGLSSLWSLTVAIPRLFVPGNSAAKFWLGVVALLKLPLYAVILAVVMSSKYFEPFAVFAGAGLVPAVIVLKVLGYQLVGERKQAPAGEEACRTRTASN